MSIVYIYISHKRIVLLISDCVNAFNTYTFKKIEDELQGRSLGKIHREGAEKDDISIYTHKYYMIQIMYHKNIFHTVAPYSKPNLSRILSLN